MSLIAGAIVRMLISKQLTLIVAGVGMMVLARLLSPGDFGTFATVLAIFLLLEIVIRLGLTEYLISAPRLSIGMLRSALGLSLTVAALVIALLLAFVLSPLSGGLERNLRASLLVLVPGLAVVPLILISQVVLQRRLDFNLIAWIGVGGVAADVMVSICLALLGAGPLALVSGVVASRLLQCVVLLARSRRLIIPRAGGWRRFMGFSPRMTLTALLPGTSDLAIVLVIPSMLGMATLGIYNRAVTVISLLDKVLLDGVAPVLLPAISERLRAGVAAQEIYGAKTARLSVLVWPVFAVLALMAEPVVLVLLGDQWTEAIPIVRILCLAGPFLPFTSMSMSFFAATGRVHDFLGIQAINQVVRVALVTAGAFHSLELAAAGLVLSQAQKCVAIHRGMRPIVGKGGAGRRREDYLRAVSVAALSLLGPACLVFALPGLPPLVLFVGGIALAAAGWLAGLALTAHPLLADIRALPLRRKWGRAGLRRALD